MAGLGDREGDVPRLAIVGVSLVLLVTLAYAASTSGVAFGLYNPHWDGTTELRSQAAELGTDPTVLQNATGYDDVDSAGTLTVVLSPETDYPDRHAVRVEAFVKSGGTLVVADDGSGPGNRLLAALDAEARLGESTLRDERYHYRSPALPIARHPSNHSLLAGVNELTLNYGTAVRPGNATVLVESSGYAYLDRNADGEPNDDERLRRHPVVTAESLGNGTVLTVSDPSVFINAMVARPGNEQFARNLLAGHDRVVLDYSHAGDLPPLTALLETVRTTPLLQVLVGLLAVVPILAWHRRWLARSLPRFRQLLRAIWPWADPQTTPVEVTADESDVVASLRRRHPEWDETRVRRIARSRQGDEE